MSITPGQKFRNALTENTPLQIVGTINAYVALMAQQLGAHAIYLSGAGVANSSYGLPDIGLTTLDNVLEDARRITAVVDLPLLVDVDTGWGSAFMVAKTVKSMSRAGVAAIHIEDQIFHKRCGHRPKKSIVSKNEMVDRVKAAVDAKLDSSFIIIARTDSLSNEGMDKAIERCRAYVEAGADAIFLEAVSSKEQYDQFKRNLNIPLLANMTEFGVTPLYTIEELSEVGVDMILYPLSANRAMNLAAQKTLETILKKGSQVECIDLMQTREELYKFLKYYEYENKLNELFKEPIDDGK